MPGIRVGRRARARPGLAAALRLAPCAGAQTRARTARLLPHDPTKPAWAGPRLLRGVAASLVTARVS